MRDPHKKTASYKKNQCILCMHQKEADTWNKPVDTEQEGNIMGMSAEHVDFLEN